MPTFQFPPTTRSGACVICGAYGSSPHRPNCAPRTGPRIRLGHWRRARADARKSAAIRKKLRVDDELTRGL
jgi:hypothetical protein